MRSSGRTTLAGAQLTSGPPNTTTSFGTRRIRMITSTTMTKSIASQNLAPGLVGPEKAARGKTPTDVWWQTIVPTNGSERTGYPTQKPIKILDRIIRVHSRKSDLVVDFFAGAAPPAKLRQTMGASFSLLTATSLQLTRWFVGWQPTRPKW